MKLVYSKTVNLVAMLALLCMLVFPYIVPATVNATDKDHGLGSENSPALLITKTDSEGNPIAGVKYEIKKTHSYDSNKDYENAFTEVSGGETIIGITNEKGQIVLEKQEHKFGIELGRYTVKEIEVPAGIVLNPTEFTVNIPTKIQGGNQDGKLDYKVEIYSKAEYVKATVELTKVDDSQKALADAQFELYKKGANGAYEKIGGTYTTNESGKIHVDGLDSGDYYFVETKAPTGYVLDTTQIEFTVTKAGEVISKSLVNYEVPTITKDIEGEKHFEVERDKDYTYNLTLNLPANIHEYTEFVVTDTLDSRLTYTGDWSVKGMDKNNIEFTTLETEAGEEVLTWTFKNLKALKDVKQVVISFKAEIKADAQLVEGETGIPNDATLQFNNGHGGQGSVTTKEVTVKPTDVQGDEDEEEGLKIIKVDADDNTITLAGAEFKLTTDEKGNKVVNTKDKAVKVNGQSVKKLENLTTNENGEILIEGLPAGTYYLHETKAPTYEDEDGKVQSYKMLTSPIEVAIQEEGLTKVTVENSKSGWDLPQTGGLGTVLFTVTGLGLMLLALIVLKRRKNESTNV